MLYHFACFVLRYLCALLFHLKVEGAENIPSRGPAIIAANHASFLDPPLIGVASKRDVYFLARESLFKIWGFGWLISRVHAFPVKPRTIDTAGFKTVFKLLDEDKVALLFPEGTRSRNGLLQQPQAGIGMIAYRMKVPVVPAFIIGANKALPRGSKIIKPVPITIRFGKPVDIEEYFNLEKNKQTYRLISEKIMAEIAKLNS